MTTAAQRAILANLPYRQFCSSIGFADSRMIADCGNTPRIGMKNAIVTMRLFAEWADANGNALPEALVSQISELYATVNDL